MNKKGEILPNKENEYEEIITYFIRPMVFHYRLFEKSRDEGSVDNAIKNYDIAAHLQDQIEDLNCREHYIKWLKGNTLDSLANICENLLVMQPMKGGV